MELALGMERLGDPTGKTAGDWVDALRRDPKSVTVLPDETRLLSWHSGLFVEQRVSALFDPQGRFVKITYRERC